MMYPRHSFLLVALLTATVVSASECTPDIAALQPPDLSKIAADDRAAGLPGAQDCASAEIQPSIRVVAYTASDIGAVRVVKTGTPATVLYDVPGKMVGGKYPAVTAMDVDGDHVNEAVVLFTSTRGVGSFSIYRWDGTKLLLISPSALDSAGVPRSTLTDISFLDVNGDGKLAVIDQKVTALGKDSDGNSIFDSIFTMYTLKNGSYTQGAPVLFFASFQRGTGAPVAQQTTIAGGAGCSTSLLVANGKENKSSRVSSAEITLNDAMVVRPDQFNQNVPSITTPITIRPGANTLAVKLAGAQDGQISVVIPGCP
jgi:hypothetical protein